MMSAEEARKNAMSGAEENASQLLKMVEGYIERAVKEGELRTTVDLTAFRQADIEVALGDLVKRGFDARAVPDGRNGSYLELSWR